MDKKSVATILFKNNRSKVLLTKRMDVPVWVLPGGGVEENETMEEAAIRETLEETGLRVAIKRKVGEFYPKNKLTRLTYLYECEILSGNLSLSDETTGIDFFDVTKLPKLMPPPYQEWIQDALLNYEYPIVKTTQSVTYPVLLQKILQHPILVGSFFIKKFLLFLKNKD